MTLQEAIKSGKPFRRSSVSLFITTMDDDIVFVDDKTADPEFNKITLSVSDILATDWEVES